MKFLLAGNPNVGKSLIFNLLTGLGVEVSNYPGTTVDIKSGILCFGREQVEIRDLPGIYSLDGESPEEELVRSVLLQHEDEVLIFIADAVHLERNLYLFVQLSEYRIPSILVLNMMDEAERRGIRIDSDTLSLLLGIDVIPASAREGRNIDRIIPAAMRNAGVPRISVQYDHHIEAAQKSLTDEYDVPLPVALLALEGKGGPAGIADAARPLAEEIAAAHHMSVRQILATNRHNCAELIAFRVLNRASPVRRWDPDRLLSTAFPGILILLLVLVGVLSTVFLVGSRIEAGIVSLFEGDLMPVIAGAGLPAPLASVLGSVVLALEAGIGIAFPYIFLFFLLTSILEDTGYLTRAAFLADRAMHRLGLHGQAIVPMVLGLGCNVPAVMSIRHLPTRRERVIASFIVTLVPCSARTVIIAGLVAVFVGPLAALSIYLILAVLIIVTGIFLSRIIPGIRYGMILEMAPLRRPEPKRALRKAWGKIGEFLVLALPLLVVCSIALGILEQTGLITAATNAIAPFPQLLFGLPAFALAALVFGILRKEMALGTLVILAGTPYLLTVLTPLQIYEFAVISVLFIPCISTMAVLLRQTGIRVMLAVSGYSITLGLLVAAVIHLFAGIPG
jgi:ferrous iron transport protein B